jgi:hypothetical protein
MRLVIRDIEMTQPQREVDRIDVFERGREKHGVHDHVRADEQRKRSWNPEPDGPAQEPRRRHP